MSIKAQNWVWFDAPIDAHVDLLVLLCLADEADDNGGSCYPSLRTIGKKARMSPSTAKDAVARLEDQNLLAVSRPENPAPGRHNSYQILVPWAVETPVDPPPDRSAPEQSTARRPPRTARPRAEQNRSEPRGPGPNVPTDPLTTDPRRHANELSPGDLAAARAQRSKIDDVHRAGSAAGIAQARAARRGPDPTTIETTNQEQPT